MKHCNNFKLNLISDNQSQKKHILNMSNQSETNNNQAAPQPG